MAVFVDLSCLSIVDSDYGYASYMKRSVGVFKKNCKIVNGWTVLYDEVCNVEMFSNVIFFEYTYTIMNLKQKQIRYGGTMYGCL